MGKEGDLFFLEVELSFPPHPLTGRSTHKLRSIFPVPWEVADRSQRFFAHHGIESVLLKVEGPPKDGN